MKNLRLFFISLLLIAVTPVIAGTATYEAQPSPTPADENHRELFDYELNYTGNSSFFDDHGKFGNGDSLYNDFSYAHRFLITGKWYFRAGVEYERFDFNGTDNGLPDHLQTVHALLALEYVVHDHAGAGIEIQPGPYFQNNVTSDSIDVPWKVWVTFPLKKDKIFAVIGAGGSIYSNPIVAPAVVSFGCSATTCVWKACSQNLPWFIIPVMIGNFGSSATCSTKVSAPMTS